MLELKPWDDLPLERNLDVQAIEALGEWEQHQRIGLMNQLCKAPDDRTMNRLQGRISQLNDLKEMLLRIQKGKQ